MIPVKQPQRQCIALDDQVCPPRPIQPAYRPLLLRSHRRRNQRLAVCPYLAQPHPSQRLKSQSCSITNPLKIIWWVLIGFALIDASIWRPWLALMPFVGRTDNERLFMGWPFLGHAADTARPVRPARRASGDRRTILWEARRAKRFCPWRACNPHHHKVLSPQVTKRRIGSNKTEKIEPCGTPRRFSVCC